MFDENHAEMTFQWDKKRQNADHNTVIWWKYQNRNKSFLLGPEKKQLFGLFLFAKLNFNSNRRFWVKSLAESLSLQLEESHVSRWFLIFPEIRNLTWIMIKITSIMIPIFEIVFMIITSMMMMLKVTCPLRSQHLWPAACTLSSPNHGSSACKSNEQVCPNFKTLRTRQSKQCKTLRGPLDTSCYMTHWWIISATTTNIKQAGMAEFYNFKSLKFLNPKHVLAGVEVHIILNEFKQLLRFID